MSCDSWPNVCVHSPIEVVMVSEPHCHFCEFAARMLLEFSQQYHLVTRQVGLETEEGASLAMRYRIPFPPVVIINGELFAYGRISRRRLQRALDAAVENSQHRVDADNPSAERC